MEIMVAPAVPVPRPDVTFQRLSDGSGVLVDARGRSYAINATGADVWELCDGQRSADDICLELLDRYEATPDLVQESLDAMLRQLEELNLLTIASGAEPDSPDGPTDGPADGATDAP